jgi:pSer/pThr/pTyr-binding forkhead associated (FHA) protein
MSNLTHCPQCNATVAEGFHFCLQCGFQLSNFAQPQVSPSASSETPQSKSVPASQHGATSSAPPAVPQSISTPVPTARPLVDLVLIRSPELQAVRFKVKDNAQIGRVHGNLIFKDDPYISPLHATFMYQGEQLYIRDEQSFNGVFVRISDSIVVKSNEVFIVGEQTCMIEDYPQGESFVRSEFDRDTRFFANSQSTKKACRLIHLLEGGQRGVCFPLIEGSLSIGRQGCDLNFPQDRFMSSRHCHLSLQDDQIILTDMGSRNGTFVKVKGDYPIEMGDFLLIGKQLLQVQSHHQGSHTHVSV